MTIKKSLIAIAAASALFASSLAVAEEESHINKIRTLIVDSVTMACQNEAAALRDTQWRLIDRKYPAFEEAVAQQAEKCLAEGGVKSVRVTIPDNQAYYLTEVATTGNVNVVITYQSGETADWFPRVRHDRRIGEWKYYGADFNY